MTEHEQAAKVAKTHTVYKLADGTRVPGTTTITGILDKPALVKWANGLGLKGIDSTKYVDELATIGTLAHYMIECHCKNEKPNLDDYTKNQIELAENSYIKWMLWQDKEGFVPTHNELQLVSEQHRFGGTIDIIGTIKGKTVLVDIKTCKGIFMEHKVQVAGGYGILAREHGHNIDKIIITRVGRNDVEGFEEVPVLQEEASAARELFLDLRKTYDSRARLMKFDKWGK
jgi:hypothetical protein